MAYKKDKIINDIKLFVSKLDEQGIKIKKAYLFGSYANGKANRYSDIDIAVVSEQLKGDLIRDNEKFIKLKVVTNDYLEIHPFRPEDFNKHNPFAREIIETGIRII